jgi:phage tail tube protein FII
MEEKFKKITVTDDKGNVKNIQEYEHNSYGDPTYFKKTVDGKVVTEIFYSYHYDELHRKTMMKMDDKVDGRVTILNYEY